MTCFYEARKMLILFSWNNFSTRCVSREEKNLMAFIECWISERWIASSYEAEGPYYWTTFSLLLHSPAQWNKYRIAHLRRLLVLSHVRHVYPSGPHKLSDVQPKDYQIYKSGLVFFGLVDACYKYFFKVNMRYSILAFVFDRFLTPPSWSPQFKFEFIL